MILNLRDVILQDIAVMMNEEGRGPHPLFQHPLFQSSDFRIYQEEMAEHMATGTDPFDSSIDAALPGVNARFDTIVNGIGDLHSAVSTGFNTVTTRLSQAATAFATELSGGSTHSRAVTPATVRHASPPATVETVFDAHISQNHSSVSTMYEEWHGRGQYANRPCPGGFEMLETKRKARWRSGYDSKELQRFIKIKRIMQSIRQQTEDQGRDVGQVLEEYDGWWTDVSSNPSNMINRLIGEQHLQAKTRRKRKQNSIDDNTDDD